MATTPHPSLAGKIADADFLGGRRNFLIIMAGAELFTLCFAGAIVLTDHR